MAVCQTYVMGVCTATLCIYMCVSVLITWPCMQHSYLHDFFALVYHCTYISFTYAFFSLMRSMPWLYVPYAISTMKMCYSGVAYCSMYEDCVDEFAKDTVHLPKNSSVVSDISSPPQPNLFPPKTTTLKLVPLPNTTAEWPCRCVIATGRVTCKNSGGWDLHMAIWCQLYVIVFHVYHARCRGKATSMPLQFHPLSNKIT